MFKRLKNSQGFTLVELMMVIAVIGILAAVLIPKMSGVKNDAKASGVSANVRMIQAQAVALIDKYADSNDGADKLEKALAGKISELKNPVTDNTGYEAVSGVNDSALSTGAAAVSIDTETEADDSWSKNETLKGCVGVSVFYANNKLQVKLTPFDADGNPGSGNDVVTVTK